MKVMNLLTVIIRGRFRDRGIYLDMYVYTDKVFY